MEDDDEYDPFSTEPSQAAPVLRDPRQAMAEVDELLLGENTGFFAAWPVGSRPAPLTAASLPAASPPVPSPPVQPSPMAVPLSADVPPAAVSPLAAVQGEEGAAPWQGQRRRRTLESRSSVTEAVITEPVPVSGAVAAYEAALLAQAAGVPIPDAPAATVDLVDSDEEIAPPPVAPLSLPAPPVAATEAVKPSLAMGSPGGPPGKPPVSMEVAVDIVDSDDETAPTQTPVVPAQQVQAAAENVGMVVETSMAEDAEMADVVDVFAQLENAAQRAQLEQAVAEQAAQVAQLEQAARHPNACLCGHILLDDAAFCRQCGAKRAQEHTVQVAQAEPVEPDVEGADGQAVDGGDAVEDVYMDPYMDVGEVSMLDDIPDEAPVELAGEPPEKVAEATTAADDSSSGEYSESSNEEDEGLDEIFATAAKACAGGAQS